MLNFRKIKQDFSSNILKQGKELHDSEAVTSARIIYLKTDAVRLSASVRGNFDNAYTCEIEIDRTESEVVDSNCDCPYNYDCQHIAAFLFYLEKHFDKIVVAYSKQTNLEECEHIDEGERQALRETFEEAETKEVARVDIKHRKELLREYVSASRALGGWPFFLAEEKLTADQAELAVIYSDEFEDPEFAEIQLALRLPMRSKPLNILNIREFLEAVQHREPVYLNGKRYYFTPDSFDTNNRRLLKLIIDHVIFAEEEDESNPRVAYIASEMFGTILAQGYELAVTTAARKGYISADDETSTKMPCFYCGSMEQPMRYCPRSANFSFELEYLESPAPKLLINPSVVTAEGELISPEESGLFECAKPGMVFNSTYYRFNRSIKRKHLRHVASMRDLTIPEPLFGTFVENSLPQLLRFGSVTNKKIIESFITLPYAGPVEATCDISYLNGELEASLHFHYDKARVPVAASSLKFEHIEPFVTNEGVLARNLSEEQNIVDELFQDFVFDSDQGIFSAKTDKKIVEFMTEVIPRNQDRVKFNCPENLLDQFFYDDTSFELSLKESDQVDFYQVKLKVNGHLEGTTVDQLWECLSANRAFIEMKSKSSAKKKRNTSTAHKILVLNLQRLAPVIQIFDEIGITTLDNHSEKRPLWSLANINDELFKDLPIKFSMSKNLIEIQKQMLGLKEVKASPVPKTICAKLREYQKEGVAWLERLRHMRLSGILADDMGLGKTLQAIVALTQNKAANKEAVSIVVCPTSLVYNWQQELSTFNSKLKVLIIDGTPAQRKKLLKKIDSHDVVITSYSLLQKDIEIYQEHSFSYAILDEAQHIKNRLTRNAKSVKMLNASHRLILTGTPIENSLDELWSLFDFLMPGLLSSFDRFVDKYIRPSRYEGSRNLEPLRAKVAPFILRRMKKDVLKELPPVSQIVYHCNLSDEQKELYSSYATSARQELTKLVNKEGFDKVQIHVLATLTRLKQICCHPAIFAKEEAECGDSAKYEMLMELIHSLIDGQRRAVIFSQYTQMLQIIRRDLEKMGIRFCYLDGSSKNRLDIVNTFNNDDTIPLFLVSLKAGGSGLNLVGADTVIHYDMWWNPAVENQATDRVHRIGQQKNVSAYKLITKGTIEEKILELQNRKRSLVTSIVSCDDEALKKLTWEEVLELLQT